MASCCGARACAVPLVCRCFRGVYAANFPGSVARVPLPPACGGGVGWFPSRVGEVYIPRFLYSITYRFPYTGNIYNNINNTLMVLSTNNLSVYKLT